MAENKFNHADTMKWMTQRDPIGTIYILNRQGLKFLGIHQMWFFESPLNV